MSQLVQLHPNLKTHDNSMLDSFNRCPRLYYYQYRRHLRPKATNPALNWGSLVHLGLDVWHKTYDLRAALEIMMKAEFDEKPEDHRTKMRALEMVTQYANYYGHRETGKAGWGFDVLFTETPFDLIGPDGMPYGGKIDMLARWRGKLYLLDHKTTSRFGADFWDTHFPGTQTAGYAWAGTHLHGEPIVGIIINAIVVHKVKKPDDQQFRRRAFDYEPWMLDEWYAQTRHALAEIDSMTEEEMYNRPRWRACIEKYGKCAFYGICRSNPENRERLLRAQYKVEEWDWRASEESSNEED